MPRYIAFLRGINVGGHRVKMDRVRDLFGEIGTTDVSTFIASGNVVFSTASADTADTEALTERIEQHLASALGYDVATFLRSPAELDAIVARGGEPDRDGAPSDPSTHVMFLREPAPDGLRRTLKNLASEMDAFEFSEAEIYWRIQGKLSESPLFGGELDRALRGIPNTSRNMNTLRRLSLKLPRD